MPPAQRRSDARSSRAPRIWILILLVAVLALVAVPLSGGAAAQSRPSPAPQVHAVTLITGDVVRLVTRADGTRAVTLEPGADGAVPRAAITETKTHLYVIPHAASRLLAAKRLDLDLFDVLGLVEQRYDDDRASRLPVLVDYGTGAAAGQRAQASSLAHAQKKRTLAALGAAAFAADKQAARRFWRSLTTGRDATGASTGLAGGATRVDLDGRVHALLDVSVPHIHAPEAWAAGFDGTGTTVAVLDSGVDLSHPDLAGKVGTTANFSEEATAADGNGHGTHVASTIAGSGAASGGLRKGVAPGASLMVGKVLGDDGFGEDSAVLAGMQWAVANGADVVNMSLGGEVSDGTDPLSRAIDELSASSDTLFVVAAGNNGGASTVTAPGAAQGALTVGAVDGDDVVAYFSSRGPRLGDGGVKPDVAAPGVSITAARAAGTSLGAPVDDFYTDLEGTSMATPHVAGIAALLKDEHPDWDGERIKAVIAGSTVPVANATAYEVGTGLVDAARAIGRTVVAEGALDLGFFPFPQAALPTTRAPLAYRNLGSSPVTLALTVEAQDGAAAPPPGVTLSAAQVTVPAGGRVAVDVVLDPGDAALGTHSGVVVARAAGAEIRTAFGFELETERYDLTVEVAPRTGTRRASHTIALIDQVTGAYEQRLVEGPGARSVTFRVAPGTYSVGAISFGLAGDGASEGLLSYRPRVELGAGTKVVLDENDTRAFGVRTDRPAATDGQIMFVNWSRGDTEFATFVLAGAFDRVYAQPFQDPGGHVDSRLNWMLSQPDAELTPPARGPVPVRSVVPAGARWSAVPAEAGRFPLVDAGAVGTLDVSKARRAIAVVSGECEDLTGAVGALRSAGAVAVVAYPSAGADCAGTLAEAPGIPVYQARPFDAARLLESAGKPVGLAPHTSPQYVYDLMGAWDGAVPDGAVLDGTSKAVGALVERYESLNTDANADYDVWDMQLGWLGDTAAFGLVRPVAVPSVVTHYLSPVAEWEPIMDVRDANGVTQALLGSPRRRVGAGETVQDRWFGGPLVTNVSSRVPDDWRATPYREGDWMFLVNLPTWVDDAGHVGYPGFEEFEGRLYRDGELLFEGDNPLWLQGSVPEERAEYRLVETTHRRNGFWQRSTTTTSEWTFSSARPGGDHENLPLLVVDYDLPLSSTSTAPAGAAYSFDVRVAAPPRVEAAALTKVRVEISWDGGASWADATLRNCSLARPGKGGAASGCTAQVRNAATGSASLRVSASDSAGRTVTQTIVDAYAVAR